jgi:hypothetical protein
LEPQLIRFIYNEELYRLEEKKSSPGKMLVAVDDSFDKQKEFLRKILSSINLSLDDVELVKKNDGLKISGLNFNIIISFGIQILEQPGLEPYSNIKVNERTIIMAESLDTITNDSTNEHKKKLWSLLKNHFK